MRRAGVVVDYAQRPPLGDDRKPEEGGDPFAGKREEHRGILRPAHEKGSFLPEYLAREELPVGTQFLLELRSFVAFVHHDLENGPVLPRQPDGTSIGLQEPGGRLRHVSQNLPHLKRGGDRPPDLVERDELGHPLSGVEIQPAVPYRPPHLHRHGGQQPDRLLGKRERGTAREVHRPVEVDVIHDGNGQDRPEVPEFPGDCQRGGGSLHVGEEYRGPFLCRLPGHPLPRLDPEIEPAAFLDLQAGRNPRDKVLPPRVTPVDADALHPGIPGNEVANVLEAVLDLDVRVGDLDDPGEEGEVVRRIVHGTGQPRTPFFLSAFS